MATVFLNGRFTDASHAAVSAFDAGFQHAVGLFETMRAKGPGGESEPSVWRLSHHLQRLADSAAMLGLSVDLRTAALAEAVMQTVRRSGLPYCRVRLTITAGDLNLLSRAAAEPGPPPDPTIMIVAQPATEYPAEMFERGVSVVVADARANPLQPFESHKTLSYWWRLRELQAASAKRAGEAIVLQVSNHVCGGCVSNLFLRRGKELITPIARGEEGPSSPTQKSGAYLPSPVLPGITRGWVLEHASELGLSTRARMISIGDVLDADEVFLTNSSWGVLPVVKVEAEAIGDGVVGHSARNLRQRWLGEL
ncbi:MAG: aminotransferase class IV [Phycisphaerales bacterium]|nr:aminotransferase class IV [Phycisphaerales bacterium]